MGTILDGEEEKLREATAEELNRTLAFALRFDGRKRTYTATDFMAHITADRLIEHMQRSGFVVMKRPPTGHVVPDHWG